MPVRSLSSSTLTWPDHKTVITALHNWAASEVSRHSNVLRLGYFGSYARKDWGVGSDLDLIAIVQESKLPFEKRSVAWDFDQLPVPAEICIYTISEWQDLSQKGSRFIRTLEKDVVWVVDNESHDQQDLTTEGS